MKKENKKYYVTRPLMPDLQEYNQYLRQIWETGVITNRGPLLQQYEEALAEHLNVSSTVVTANATLALMVVMRAMDLTGEVITTPFTFAASAGAIVWSGLTPVFVDVEPGGVNICPESVKAAITPNTSAILAVHCYGVPSKVDALREIADEYQLKLIYDACHAFGTETDKGSILKRGDASILSLHATKLVSSAEGGLIVSSDEQLLNRVRLNINFGIKNENEIPDIGINAKMSELHAAFGLCNLNSMQDIYAGRREIYEAYKRHLEKIPNLSLLPRPKLSRDGFAYIPVIVEASSPFNAQTLKDSLERKGIFVRRYFYPLLTDTDAFKKYAHEISDMYVNARSISSRVLCLPIYYGINESDVQFICNEIAIVLNEP